MPWRTSVVTNGRRIDARSDWGMPGPVSLTTTRPDALAERDVDRDLATGGRRVQGVRDEIRDDLQHAVAVAEHDRARLRPARAG